MRLSDIMRHACLASYAEIALVLFLVAFVGILLWVLRPGASRRMEHDARLPLDDDGADAPRPGDHA